MYRLAVPNPEFPRRVARHIAFERTYFERVWLKSSVISLQLRENAIAGASIPSYPTMIAAKPIAQVKRPSNKRARFNFGVSHLAQVSQRVARSAPILTTHSRRSQNTSRERGVVADFVGLIDKIDEMPGRRHYVRWSATNFGAVDPRDAISSPNEPYLPSSVARAIKRAKDVPEGILYARPDFALPNRWRPCGIDGWTLSHLRHPRHSPVVLLRWAHMSSLTSERREWKRDSRPDRPLNVRNVSLCCSSAPILGLAKFSPGRTRRHLSSINS